MVDVTLPGRSTLSKIDPVLAIAAMVVLGLFVLAPSQGVASAEFTLRALVGVAPFLLASIAIAAYAKASGAERLIAKAFTGNIKRMIVFAALMGALSPFCSCGVIPLIRSRRSWPFGWHRR